MKTYALVGKSLKHSFSSIYFTEKFFKEGLIAQYINLEMSSLRNLKKEIILKNIDGFNITIPYKQQILPLLDFVDEDSKKIGSVNTVKIINGKFYGFNTDIIGFKKSISPLIKERKSALILGDGGVSKSVQLALSDLNINFKVVSRGSNFIYSDISKKILENNEIIINCTPLGSYPNIEQFPAMPYKYLNSKHLLFDVVYNPPQSKFLTFGLSNKSIIKNGEEMLIIQAEESWKIWNTNINLLYK